MTMVTAPAAKSLADESVTLADQLSAAIAGAAALEPLGNQAPASRRDRFLALLEIYDLHSAPVVGLGTAAEYVAHPVIASIKHRCETDWLAELNRLAAPDGIDVDDPVAAMRALAARDRLPAIYKWLAHEASWEDIVTFLALEGGPDAGFDDLVAACQIGLTGRAKLELATNYWDEMGNGDLAAVHTTLHDNLVAAIDMPLLPLAGLPTSALERLALGGLLSTNRWLQPEALGALGLIELQAGPRCRLVLQAFDRCHAPSQAYPFYEVHAEVDPRHGRDWLDNAITPTVEQTPEWAPPIIKGAQWRSAINAAFLNDAGRMIKQD